MTNKAVFFLFCFFVVLIKCSDQKGYYSETCDIFIKPKSKYKHFESNIQKELDKCKHISK